MEAVKTEVNGTPLPQRKVGGALAGGAGPKGAQNLIDKKPIFNQNNKNGPQNLRGRGSRNNRFAQNQGANNGPAGAGVGANVGGGGNNAGSANNANATAVNKPVQGGQTGQAGPGSQTAAKSQTGGQGSQVGQGQGSQTGQQSGPGNNQNNAGGNRFFQRRNQVNVSISIVSHTLPTIYSFFHIPPFNCVVQSFLRCSQ